MATFVSEGSKGQRRSSIFRIPSALQWTAPPQIVVRKKNRSKRQLALDLFQDAHKPEDVLSYLPQKISFDYLPGTKELLLNITNQYIMGDTISAATGTAKVTSCDVLQVIRQEYQNIDNPLRVGDDEIGLRRTTRSQRNLILILSFAALHRLPMEVVLHLFRQDPAFKPYLDILARGWKSISFPRGVAIQLPRSRVNSRRERMLPVPRRWLWRRNERSATQMIKEAAQTKPPPQRLTTEEEFFEALEMELRRSSRANPFFEKFLQQGLDFFPTRNSKLQRLKDSIRTRLQQLAGAIKAWTLSGIFVSLSSFILSIFQAWYGLPIDHAVSSSGAFSSTIHRLQSVLQSLNGGSQVLRIGLATLVTPAASRVLSLTKDRLKMSENRAFVMLSAAMLSTTVALLGGIFFFDTTLVRTIL